MAALRRIDLADRSCVADIRNVCGGHGPGFFYLKMLPHEEKAAAQALDMCKEFFALPFEEKMSLATGPETFYRYQGFAIPGSGPGYRATAKDPNFATDTRESFNLGRDVASDTTPPHGPNLWPRESSLPGFRAVCDEYASVLCEKSCHLRRAIAEAVGMPADHFDAPGLFDLPTWLLGFVHYDCVASHPEQNSYGIKPHQDDGIFTLLYTDGSPGLQICPEWKGSDIHREEAMLADSLTWIGVEHIPGHWVVNLGTMLQRWTNGTFKATLHRVVTNGESHRYSLPFFYEPNIDARIECLASCVRDGKELPQATTPGSIMLEMAMQDGLQVQSVAAGLEGVGSARL